MKKTALLTCVAALCLGTAAFAANGPRGFEYQGPGSFVPQGFENNAPNTVRAIKSSAYDDQIVVLRGRLTRYLGKDMYEFTDLNGDTIDVELDDDRNFSHIAKDMLIEITAEVDKDLLSTTLDVKKAEPVKEPR